MELAFCGLALLLLALDPGADATARPLPRVIVEDGALTPKPACGSAWQAEIAIGWPRGKDPLMHYD